MSDPRLMFDAIYLLTNAPREYDYPYTIPGPATLDPEGRECRMVAVTEDRADYQTGRYQSGLYFVIPTADISPILARAYSERFEQLLWNRIFNADGIHGELG